MFSQPRWCHSIAGTEVPLPSRPLYHCCLLTSLSPFKLISGTTFQLDMFCNLQELIFSPILYLISFMIFITPGPVECLHSSFKYNSSYIPNSPSHMPIYIFTTKLQSGGWSVNVYRERRGQTFSYSNLHHRRNSSSHWPYELNGTLVAYRKTIIFLPLSACAFRSLCFPVRCCWFHQNISSFPSVFQKNTRLTSSHTSAVGYIKTWVFIYMYKLKNVFVHSKSILVQRCSS